MIFTFVCTGFWKLVCVSFVKICFLHRSNYKWKKLTKSKRLAIASSNTVGTSKTSSRDLCLTYLIKELQSRFYIMTLSESILLYLNRWSAMEKDGRLWIDRFHQMVVSTRRQKSTASKLYTLMLGYLCFEYFFLLCTLEQDSHREGGRKREDE